MKVLVYFLLLLTCPGAVLTNICSMNVLFTSETIDLYNKDTRQYTEETTVHFNIGLKETVCFEVVDIYTPGSPSTIYSLSFSDVESIFTYKNSYEFAVAKPSVTCLCDCPGLEDHCSPNRDNCREDRREGEGCWNFYKGEESSEGCGLFSPMGAAEICCSVVFEAYEKERFKAFEISTPVTRGSFRLSSGSGGGGKDFIADLDKGSKIFLEDVSVSFETPGKTVPVPDGWYYGPARSTDVLTNVKINGLNEWDINKLGWLKYTSTGELQYHDLEIDPVFTAQTVNCKENNVEVEFASDYSNREITEAQKLETYYSSTVETARRLDDNRHLIVTFRQYDKLKAMLTFPGKKKIIQHFSAAQFTDFQGVALLDKHSNRVLNITVFGGVGKLHGSMKLAGESVESFDFIIDTVRGEEGRVEPVDYNNYVQITQWCTNRGKTELCLHTGDSNNEICKVIHCEAEENRQFEIPSTAIDYKAGERESLGNPAVWKRYINPAEWFNGITGLQELVCMLSVLSLTLLLLISFTLLITKTKLKYHIALVWSRFPVLHDKYRNKLVEYGTEGLERESPPCRVRCRVRCRGPCCVFSRCCCRRGSESDSSDCTSTSSYTPSWDKMYRDHDRRYGDRRNEAGERSMARNHYEMDDYYEEISYSDRDQRVGETGLGRVCSGDESYDSSSSS